MASEVRLQNILGDYKTTIQAIAYLCENKTIASMVAHLDEFNPQHVTANNIEELSLFGPLFRLSAYPDTAVSQFREIYSGIKKKYTDISYSIAQGC
jgi:ubiquitin conjugation factor E4 B